MADQYQNQLNWNASAEDRRLGPRYGQTGDPPPWAGLSGGYMHDGHTWPPSADQSAPRSIPQSAQSMHYGSYQYSEALPSSGQNMFGNTGGTMNPTYQNDPIQHVPDSPTTSDLARHLSHVGTRDTDLYTFSGTLTREPSNTLDRTYKLRNEDFFVAGRVVACLWTEPAGERCTPNFKDVRLTKVFLGGYAYTNTQRFVIIAPRREQHLSICCPIKTYGFRGTAKFDDKARNQHSIIYTDLSMEEKVTSDNNYKNLPIRMDPADHFIILDEKSRINFGKPTPVEHNLRMKYIGDINSDHMKRLFRYFNEVNKTTYKISLSRGEKLIDTTSRPRSSAHTSTQQSIADPTPEQGRRDDGACDEDVGSPKEDVIHTTSGRRNSTYRSIRRSEADAIPNQGRDNYDHDDGSGNGDAGELGENLVQAGSSRGGSSYIPTWHSVAGSIPWQGRHGGGDGGDHDISSAGEDLIHSTSRRRSLAYRSSRHRTTETILEQEHDDHDDGVVGLVEGEGNAGRSRTMERRGSHASHGYRDADREYQVHRTQTLHRQDHHRSGTATDRSNMRSPQVSITGHTRTRTEQIPPGHHSQERRCGRG